MTRRARRGLPLVVALSAITAAALSGCAWSGDRAAPPTATAPAPTTPPKPTPTAIPRATVPVGTDDGRGEPATAVLAALTVRGRGPLTGYTRQQFGQTWADVDRNGCDTRNDILRRDLAATRLKAGTRDCLVLAGRLDPDPYTAATISFARGGPPEVDVDHVVALANAWVSGGVRAAPDARAALANDPLNLLAVDASANRQKGDGDAATWLPPNRAFRCDYVARQTAVKAKYHLSVTPAERDAIRRVLSTCPDLRAPAGGGDAVATGFGATPPPVAPPAPAASLPVSPTATDYGTCAAAIAAGGGNYRRGDPEFGFYDDRDHDGVVCEH